MMQMLTVNIILSTGPTLIPINFTSVNVYEALTQKHYCLYFSLF